MLHLPTLAAKARKLLMLLPHKRYRMAALRHGVAAAIEHTSILRCIPAPGPDLVIDVGANVGQFSLISRELFPQAPLIAVEPIQIAVDRYQRVFRNDPSVSALRAAISPTAGQARLNVSAAMDSSSLLPITTRQVATFPGTQVSAVMLVPTFTLSDLVARAPQAFERGLLKLDVQGFELEALRSGETVLDRFLWILAECSFVEFYDGQPLAHDIIRWLDRKGFVLDRVGKPTYARDGSPVQCDFLFRRSVTTQS